ncbi:hypothetical protein [Tropicibacter sp. S64]|uniref:hypothetical protein n=1 Tax=Tropicibacter sp. S64 TaxID=3415122 RepID=UPI003C7B8366
MAVLYALPWQIAFLRRGATGIGTGCDGSAVLGKPLHDGGHVALETAGQEDVQEGCKRVGAIAEVMRDAGRDTQEGARCVALPLVSDQKF